MKTILCVMAAAAATWAEDTSREAAVRKLETLKVSVDLDRVRFSEAIDYLRDVSGLNLVVSESARARAGEEPVRLKLREVSLKSVLRLLTGDKDLAATWRDGVVLILPREELASAVTMRLYDVRSLLVKIRDFEGPKVELASPSSTGGPMLGGVFTLVEPAPRIEENTLLDLVRESTGGRSWEANSSASIALTNGILVVSQTPSVHEEVRSFLARLEQVR